MEHEESFRAGYASAFEDVRALVERMAGPGYPGAAGLILAHVHRRLREMEQKRRWPAPAA